MMSFSCPPAGDAVLIEDLRLPARIGVHPSERGREQAIDLSLEIGLPTRRPFTSDDVDHTIDYTAVIKALGHLCVSRHFGLAECLAEEVARVVLGDFGALWVRVRLRKVNIAPGVRFVGASILRRQGFLKWLRRKLLAASMTTDTLRASTAIESMAGSGEVRT